MFVISFNSLSFCWCSFPFVIFCVCVISTNEVTWLRRLSPSLHPMVYPSLVLRGHLTVLHLWGIIFIFSLSDYSNELRKEKWNKNGNLCYFCTDKKTCCFLFFLLSTVVQMTLLHQHRRVTQNWPIRLILKYCGPGGSCHRLHRYRSTNVIFLFIFL